MRTLLPWLGALALFLAIPGGAGASLTVGAGSSISLGDANVYLGENDLELAGTLNGGSGLIDRVRHLTIDESATLNAESGTIQICGDWTNSGTFIAGASVVRFVDGCDLSSAEISGNTTFARMDMRTTSGKQYRFTAGSVQTVLGWLGLYGAPENLLAIRSTQEEIEAFFEVQGSGGGNFVDVRDIDASSGNPILVGPQSTIGSNTSGWSFGVAVPTAGALVLALLLVSLLWSGRRALGVSRSPVHD